MPCKPCRVTYQDKCYAIDGAGTVTVRERQIMTIGFLPVEPELARVIRTEASRQRRNRNRRERHQAITDLGLIRVRGNLGGTYYE